MSLQEELARYRAPDSIVPVEAFGRMLYVRKISMDERGFFERYITIGSFKGKGRRRAWHTEDVLSDKMKSALIVLALCDADGKRIYNAPIADKQAFEADRQQVGSLSDVEGDKLYDAACRLNRMLKYGEDAVEEAKKNSEKTPN